MANINTTMTDEQLVNYVLGLLSDDEMQHISNAQENDAELSQRICFWQEALFKLNDTTEAVTPPKSVWNNIEEKLFMAPEEKKKPKLMAYFLPAFVTLSLVFFSIFYYSHQPSYKATIVDNGQVIWEVEGNSKSMSFVSLADVEMIDMDCVVWVKKAGSSQGVRIGRIPDSGHNAKIRMALPSNVKIGPGDIITVAMVDEDYKKETMPVSTKGRYQETVLDNI